MEQMRKKCKITNSVNRYNYNDIVSAIVEIMRESDSKYKRTNAIIFVKSLKHNFRILERNYEFLGFYSYSDNANSYDIHFFYLVKKIRNTFSGALLYLDMVKTLKDKPAILVVYSHNTYMKKLIEKTNKSRFQKLTINEKYKAMDKSGAVGTYYQLIPLKTG